MLHNYHSTKVISIIMMENIYWVLTEMPARLYLIFFGFDPISSETGGSIS